MVKLKMEWTVEEFSPDGFYERQTVISEIFLKNLIRKILKKLRAQRRRKIFPENIEMVFRITANVLINPLSIFTCCHIGRTLDKKGIITNYLDASMWYFKEFNGEFPIEYLKVKEEFENICALIANQLKKDIDEEILKDLETNELVRKINKVCKICEGELPFKEGDKFVVMCSCGRRYCPKPKFIKREDISINQKFFSEDLKPGIYFYDIRKAAKRYGESNDLSF